jgi:hypothetical protein
MLKIGDVVELCPTSEWCGTSLDNPVGVKGKVSYVYEEGDGGYFDVQVAWEGGLKNSYNPTDLVLVEGYSMSKLEDMKVVEARLRKALAELDELIAKLEKPKQWEPRGGYCSLTGHR